MKLKHSIKWCCRFWKTWNLKTYVPHYSTWKDVPGDAINRVAMEKSYLKDIFTHYLGIDRKNALNSENGNSVKEKKKK
jgi:hypothetical protein